MEKGYLPFPTTTTPEVIHYNKTLNPNSEYIYYIGEFLNFVSAVPPRSLDPSKDLAVYGYGSIAWKERMESWKQKQEMMKDGEDGEDEFDLSM